VGSALQSFDQPGVDQQPVEAARLGAAGAAIEQALAALEDLLLLGEGCIERQPGGLRSPVVGCVERIARRRQIDRREADGVDRVIGREKRGRAA
jgi:hypothetical protein